MANLAGNWDSMTANGRARKVLFDLEEFRFFCRNLDNFYAFVRSELGRTAQHAYMLGYRELTSNSLPTGLLDFLCVNPDVQLSSVMRKQNSASLRDRIENFDEMSALLAGTEYEQWIDRPG